MIIYVLLVAHFVADFLCQSDWMALNKSKRWDALGVHVLVYSLVLWFSVVGYGGVHLYPRHTIGVVSLFVLVNGIAHFGQDAITSRITSRLWFLKFVLAGKRWRVIDGDARAGVQQEQEAYYIDDLGTRHWFFVAIGFDQLLHLVTLFVTAEWWL